MRSNTTSSSCTRNREILAAIHHRTTQVNSSDEDWEEFRALARLLLRALARETFSAPPPERLARHVHKTVRELINERLATVTNGQSASAWLTRTLRDIDNEETAADNRQSYVTWVAAAGRALTSILRATEPDGVLPGRSVMAYTSRVRKNITASLNKLEGTRLPQP
ncbi:hypothetical protein ACF08N_37405 [Streptomyces sp. NPDC015127]|uniref:hypothetical protein n=1 Tax=Streptomyces sp. NPDC015127 TaxID=3364939 RepID=UPI003702EBA1